ncbi:MAG: MmcQ/YjbR family DNA-binding protein [Ignavibacteria bacterium]
MDLEQLQSYCLSKKHATEDYPFGEGTLAFRVKEKIFALTSVTGNPESVNLKCNPELAVDLRERYDDVKPGYHMNKKHWNTVVITGKIPDKEIENMIDHSYDLIFKSLSQKIRKELV